VSSLRGGWLLACFVGMTIPATTSVAASDSAVLGTYLVENGDAHIELGACGDRLCGSIVWLRRAMDEDGATPLDIYNPEPALRSRPILGLRILEGLEPAAAPGRWVGGRIYDPESGKTYRCKLRFDGEDRVRLRGYVGVSLLGRTTEWTRVASRSGPAATTVSSPE